MTERGKALLALFNASTAWADASTNIESAPENVHTACGNLIAAALEFAKASGWSPPLEEMREAETQRLRVPR